MIVMFDIPAGHLLALLNTATRSLPAPWTADLGAVPELDAIGVFAPNADPAAVVGLVGYFLRGPLAMGGEWEDAAAVVEPSGFVRFPLDITKSRRDDSYAVLTDPDTGLAAYLRDGSPVRTTDRAGAGTKGTRAWAGLPGPVLLLWR
jgi:hypothetical protein